VYGTLNQSKKIIDYLLDGFQSEKPIALTDGNQEIDFIYIDNVTEILIDILEKPGFYSENQYVISSGDTLTVRKMAVIIEEILQTTLKLDWGKLPYPAHQSMKNEYNKSIKVLLTKMSLGEGIKKYLEIRKLI
jgi:nucleoside-diphosphate-sugar epimerase